MNWNLLVVRMRSWRECLISLGLMLTRRLIVMRGRLRWSLRSFKGLMVLSKGRIIRLELWVARFRTPNKISDFPPHSNQRSAPSSTTTEQNSKPQTNNPTPTNLKSKSCSQKTQTSANKWETPNRTSDYQRLKSESLTTNLRLHATRTKSSKEGWMIWGRRASFWPRLRRSLTFCRNRLKG